MAEELNLEQFYNLIREVYDAVMMEEMERSSEGLIKEMTFHELHTIENIGDNPGATMTDLAKLAGVTTSSMTTMIDKLVTRGLVKRRRRNSDRRVVVVSLTELGKKAYREHGQVHAKVGQELLALMDDDERRVVLSLYEKILDWSKRQKESTQS